MPCCAFTHQIAGHSQAPLGNLATTSTLPYLIECFPLVFNRALLIGLTIVPLVELLSVEQSPFGITLVLVQVPSVVRFRVWPFWIWSSVMLVVSTVKVGTMCKPW